MRRQRRAVDLQKAAVDSATPLRHGPVRQALIEIARQESNERRMDPGVGVEAVHGPDQVAMPNRRGAAASAVARGAPTASRQAFHRRRTALRSSPADRRARSRAANADRASAGRSVRKCDSAAVSSRIHESSRPVAAGMPWSTMARQRSRRVTPATSSRASAPSCSRAARDFSGENAARRQLLAIARFGQKRLAAEPLGGALDGLFERQVLEGVQGVVVDEDADGALRRQQVRQADRSRARADGRGGRHRATAADGASRAC